MTEQSGTTKPTFGQRASASFYGIVLNPGWPRRILTLVALVCILLAASILAGRKSYRKNPAALVPPSVSAYIEAKALTGLLETMNGWSLWREERRSGRENQLQVEVASSIGRQVSGLGTSLPLRWLASTERAAYAIARGTEGGEDSWALFLQMLSARTAIDELKIELEPGMSLDVVKEQRKNGVYLLNDGKGGSLHLAVVEPWLIISSGEYLPLYAMDNASKAAPALEGTNLLPALKYSTMVRGIFDPSYASIAYQLAGTAVFTAWVAPDTRVAFTSSMGPKGGVDMTFTSHAYTGEISSGGFLRLMRGFALLLGCAGVIVVVFVLMAMAGMGGWLKARALRSRVSPAPKPAPVEPSSAFKEDIGTEAAPGVTGESSGSIVDGAQAQPPPAPSVEENVSANPESEAIDVAADTAAPKSSSIADGISEERASIPEQDGSAPDTSEENA